ncbi:hypothetical protein [Gimesia benthica]|uniref:hypothetical protein n=1 Tax=Gimesia benthica TaxID=2608982 RepID=UPI00188568AC|nr:hypothetical protein [Gimesia benthica]
MSYEIEVKAAEFIKVSTNVFGGLRFKTSNVSEAVELYADQISTNRNHFSSSDVQSLAGFNIKKIKDHSRCLKQLQPANSENSSMESSKD